MRKRQLIILSVVIVFISNCAWSWGPEAHELITKKAISILPTELKTFYEINSRYIVPMSNLPDDWRETYKSQIAPEHYIDLDKLDTPPFKNLIVDRDTAEKRFGKQRLRDAGLLPWAIVQRYEKLVQAMRKMDTVEIVVQSAIIAHYVADAHVPFHNTRFYDGKTPEQKGIHFRWEENLVSLTVKRSQVRPTKPAVVRDPLKSAFSWCISSYKLVDPILKAEDKARGIDPTHGFRYYESLRKDTGSILIGRLKSASEALAGAYVAAWKEAGKPALPAKHAPLFWGH